MIWMVMLFQNPRYLGIQFFGWLDNEFNKVLLLFDPFSTSKKGDNIPTKQFILGGFKDL